METNKKNLKYFMVLINTLVFILSLGATATNLITGDFKLAWICVMPTVYSILNIIAID